MIALHSPANNRFVTMDKNGHVRDSGVPFSSLGTQKEHKHKHFIWKALPYWAYLLRGFIWDPDPNFCLCVFWEPYLSCFEDFQKSSLKP